MGVVALRFCWLCSLLSLGVLSAAVLWLEPQPAGLLGLGRSASLVLVVWGLGLGSTALIAAHERAARRRLVKAARRDSEREAVHRVAEVAAHELTRPLTVVMAYAQWLQQGRASPRDAGHYLAQMVSACHEMSAILRHLHETIRHSRANIGLTVVDEPFATQEMGQAGDEAMRPGAANAGGGAGWQERVRGATS